MKKKKNQLVIMSAIILLVQIWNKSPENSASVADANKPVTAVPIVNNVIGPYTRSSAGKNTDQFSGKGHQNGEFNYSVRINSNNSEREGRGQVPF